MNMAMKNVVREFELIDLSDLNERIAAIDAGQIETQDAERRAEERCTDITRLISEWKEIDGAAIADAILEGSVEGVTAAAPGLDDLTNERAGLRAAIGELRRRAQSASELRRSLQHEAKARSAPLAAPVIEQMRQEALTAARTLVNVWTATQAISRVTGSGDAAMLGRELEEVAAAFYDNQGLLVSERSNSLPIPANIVAMLSGLAEKGAALPFHSFTEIPRPVARANVFLAPQ